jgi:hypothetical protein
MVRAGRHASDADVEQGAYAMERGVTAAQVEALVRVLPADRPVTMASLVSQAGVNTTAGAMAGHGLGVAAAATSTTNAAVKGAGSVAGSVTGALTAGVKKP